MRIINLLSPHAYLRHGADVNRALNCLGKNGSARSFKTFGFKDHLTGDPIDTNAWLCMDGKDWFVVVTTMFKKVGEDKVADLVTAYKVTFDVFTNIDDFIAHLQSGWKAIEINYKIGLEEIFLRPR